MEISHGVIPGLSGVGIDLPAVSLLSGGPVWDSVSFENGSWLSVESNFSDSLKQGVGVEVLSINVVHEVWLFVELVHVVHLQH